MKAWNGWTKKNGRLVPARLVVSLGLYAICAINEGLPNALTRYCGVPTAARRDLNQTKANSTAPSANAAAATSKGNWNDPVRCASGAANSGPTICPTPYEAVA